MSYLGHELLPAIASTLTGWRGVIRALTPELLAKLLKQHGHPDEAEYVAKMREGGDFRGMLQQAVAFSREGEQQDWEREDRNMDPVRDSIHHFVTEHLVEATQKVVLVPDDIDRHGAGCSCGKCNSQGKSFGVAIFKEGEQDNGDPIERVYGPSEEAAMDAAKTVAKKKKLTVTTSEDLDERVTTQRKATDVGAKTARRKEKLARKKERGAEKLRAKKYRHTAMGKRATKRRATARGKLSPTALKKKNVIRHYQPQQSGLEDMQFGRLVAELKSIALVRP